MRPTELMSTEKPLVVSLVEVNITLGWLGRAGEVLMTGSGGKKVICLRDAVVILTPDSKKISLINSARVSADPDSAQETSEPFAVL